MQFLPVFYDFEEEKRNYKNRSLIYCRYFLYVFSLMKVCFMGSEAYFMRFF